MQVASDTLVTIAVKMYDLQKNLLEQANDLVYLHGHGDIFPVIEKRWKGRNRVTLFQFNWNPRKRLATMMKAPLSSVLKVTLMAELK